jgi:hypothetical protein
MVNLKIDENYKLIKMKEIIEKINEGLKDPDYRQSWIANMAMAQLDNERWYREKKIIKLVNI